MTPAQRFSANLKALRQNAGETQATTAAAVGLTRSTYSGYESGAAEPDLQTLVRFSVHFSTSLGTLIRREITFMSNLHNVRMDGTRMLVGLQMT